MKKFFVNNLAIIFILFVAIFSVACGHSHAYTSTTIAPTINTNGYTRHSCSCGKFYDTNITCLLTFESTCTDTTIAISALPNVSSKIVEQNSLFEEIENTNNFKISSYIGLDVGQQITNSTCVTIIWQPRTQAEKDCLNIISKINKLYEISYNYNPEKSLLRAFQYIRTAKYTSNVWNMMGGNLESDFANYVAENQGIYNISSLQTINNMFSPITNEGIDFIHMFGVLNTIENSDGVNSGASDVAGWIGDLCTLVQEIVNAGVSGNEITTLANQKFNSTNSTFCCYDLIADLDAVNIMQEYYSSSNKPFAKVMEEYYLTTSIQMRKTKFLNTVFNKAYTSATTMANDIIDRIKNNFFATYFCNTLNINLTTHAEQFLAAATAFANYFI